MDAQTIRILLVEDNEADVHLVEAFLDQSLGAAFVLNHVGRLSDGLNRLKREVFDIVLLDLHLPDSTGLDTFRAVYAQASRVPIVVLSGIEDEADARAAVRAGADDYLVKGKTDGYLLARSLQFSIERAARLKQYVAERVTITQNVVQITDRLENLSPREREVLERIADGMTLKQIARALGTSYNTVKNQRASILEKLEAQSESDLVRMVLIVRFGK